MNWHRYTSVSVIEHGMSFDAFDIDNYCILNFRDCVCDC